MHQKYTDYDMKHITPDMTEADIILPTIHFSEQANVAVDKVAGRAWEEDFEAIHHHQIAPHYRHSTAIQTILPDGSVLGNLTRTIPEAITTLRGKLKL